MRIGELAYKTRLPPSTIRFYESLGLLPRATRHNGQRRFDREAELYVAVVKVARQAGFTLAEVKLLFHGFERSAPASERWKKLAQRKLREIDLQMMRLRGIRKLLKGSMRCRCVQFQECGRILISLRRSNSARPSSGSSAAMGPARRISRNSADSKT